MWLTSSLTFFQCVGVGVGFDVDVGDGDGVGLGEGVGVGEGEGVGDGDGVGLGVAVGVMPEVGVIWGEGVAPVLVGTATVLVGSTGFPGMGERCKFCRANSDSTTSASTTARIAAMSNSIRPVLRSREPGRTTGDG